MYWTWQGATPVPSVLSLTGTQERPLRAALSFQTKQPAVDPLPVTITRRLSRLVPGDEAFTFKLEPVGTKPLVQRQPVSGRSDPHQQSRRNRCATACSKCRCHRARMSSAPRGASSCMGKDGTEPDRAGEGPFRAGTNGLYAVPVDALSGELRLRHLVRFSQKGQFNLPPVRFTQVYAPQHQAQEAKTGPRSGHGQLT